MVDGISFVEQEQHHHHGCDGKRRKGSQIPGREDGRSFGRQKNSISMETSLYVYSTSLPDLSHLKFLIICSLLQAIKNWSLGRDDNKMEQAYSFSFPPSTFELEMKLGTKQVSNPGFC